MFDFLQKKNQEITNNYNSIHHKNLTDLDTAFMKLEEKHISKVRNMMGDILDKKSQVIKDIDDIKQETIKRINQIKTETNNEFNENKTLSIDQIATLKNNINSIHEIIIEKLRKIDTNIEKISSCILKIEKFESDLTKNYDDKIGQICEIKLTEFENKIKEKSKEIIQTVFNETLATLGKAIDDQINRQIEKRFNKK
jgi:hypothetical protein